MNTEEGKLTFTREMIIQQLSDSSRALVDLTANMVYDEPLLLKLLIEVSWLDKDPWSNRASRVVSVCCCRFPDLLKPYTSSIIKKLIALNSESVIRNYLKIFAEVPIKITNKNKSMLLNLCFDYLSHSYAISVRVYSMEILFNLSDEIPEIKRELYILIDEQLPESSPGFRSRGEKILKKLMKGSLH
jgi:hypothetical protein